MAGLAEAVQGAVGQPASIRIGMVDSIDSDTLLPQISVGGTVFEDVGVPSGVVLLAGNPVILIGQSSVAGSDPASWLVIGSASPYGLRSIGAMNSTFTPLPAALTPLPGTERTFDTVLPQTLVEMWIYADLEMIIATISTAVARPRLNGANLGTSTQAIAENSASTGGRWTVGSYAQFVVAPGTHTVELAAHTAVGTANSFAANPETTGYLMHVHG